MKQEDVRGELAIAIEESIRHSDGLLEHVDATVVRVFEAESDVGPLGGKQWKVMLAIDDGTDIHAALVVVYCDDNIMLKLQGQLERESERRELRNRLLG